MVMRLRFADFPFAGTGVFAGTGAGALAPIDGKQRLAWRSRHNSVARDLPRKRYTAASIRAFSSVAPWDLGLRAAFAGSVRSGWPDL